MDKIEIQRKDTAFNLIALFEGMAEYLKGQPTKQLINVAFTLWFDSLSETKIEEDL